MNASRAGSWRTTRRALSCRSDARRAGVGFRRSSTFSTARRPKRRRRSLALAADERAVAPLTPRRFSSLPVLNVVADIERRARVGSRALLHFRHGAEVGEFVYDGPDHRDRNVAHFVVHPAPRIEAERFRAAHQFGPEFLRQM